MKLIATAAHKSTDVDLYTNPLEVDLDDTNSGSEEKFENSEANAKRIQVLVKFGEIVHGLAGSGIMTWTIKLGDAAPIPSPMTDTFTITNGIMIWESPIFTVSATGGFSNKVSVEFQSDNAADTTVHVSAEIYEVSGLDANGRVDVGAVAGATPLTAVGIAREVAKRIMRFLR